MNTRHLLLALILACAAGTAQAAKGCDALRAAIDARVQAKGVRGYSLDVVGAADVGSARVVGECEGGAKRIVYARGSGGRANMAETAPAPAPNPSSAAAGAAQSAAPAKPKSPPPALGNY